MAITQFQIASPLLTEQDLRLFLKEPVSIGQRLRPLFMSGAVFMLTLVAVYGLFNYSALLRIYGTEPAIATDVLTTPVPQSTPASVPEQAAPAAAPTPTPKPDPTIPKDSISIPALGVSGEIAWDTPFDDSIIQDKLPNTIVHFAGTAKPGQHGTVVLTGHSSNYPWIKGRYNTIFAPLHKAKESQTFVVNYDDNEYTYKITKVYQVDPSDLGVLKAGDTDGIRLITCTPIGTSLRRLIVEAVQVSPSTDGNAAFDQTEFSGSLPGAL